MTYKEAYKKLCEFCGDKPTVVMCREYGEFFGFYLAPEKSPDSNRYFVGSEMMCVLKDTGKVVLEDDMDNFDFYNERWRRVRVDEE